MKQNHLLLVVLLALSTSLFAQSIQLRTGSFQPASNIRKEAIDSFNISSKRFSGQSFAVIQFNRLPTTGEQKALIANGITLLEYLPQYAYTVSIKGNVSADALRLAGARSIFQLQPKQKMPEYFARGIIPSWAVKVAGTVDVWISFQKTVTAPEVLAQLRAANVDILSEEHKQYRVLALRIAANRIQEIAALPFVEYIQPAPPKDQPLNYNSRVGSGANALNASVTNGGRGLNGQGIVIGVGDNADIQNHVDFNGRIINRNAAGFAAHGVHVAGTVAGAGNIAELYRGYAPKATIVSQFFGSVVDNAATYVNDYGMVITNNSYGNIIDCDYHGTYDLYSRIMDQQAFDLPNLLNVFAAGNSGGDNCPPYSQGFHTVIGSYQSAKNVVTVGATDDFGAVATFSSKGPVKDGRLKPEITAMGAAVISAWPTNTYSYNNGTSMAAPGVSGGLALLYQRYRQLHSGANPKNGLMKAILCNGAIDKGTAGPDFRNGFGWMNLLRSVEALENNTYFSGNSNHGANTTHTITVPANTAQLKVMLYWNDLPASVLSTKNLVNDLDLEVTMPTSTIVFPRILDTTNVNLNNAGTTGPDHVNNIEQVVIDNPAAGTYTFTIKGTTVTNAQQEYFLVYDAVPTSLKITTPVGGHSLVPGEVTKIGWEAFGYSGTATLDFSEDGGATWTTINANVDVNAMLYNWTVPSVATDKAMVRITKNGTGETSLSNLFTIVGQPTISLSAVQCEGYIPVNWNTISGATDYEVMMLQGDEMKSIATTTDTSFTFSGLSKDSVYWVTVRARVNGKTGRRANAMAHQPNGGTCVGTISDNDLKMDAILAPQTGRLFTSNQLSTTQPITVRIKNLDDAPVANYSVAYSINGGAVVTENITTAIAAGATYDHTFSTTADFSAPGSYTIVASVQNSGDLVTTNDAMTIVVKQIDNQPIDLTTAFLDNLESAATATYNKDTLGFTGIERYDFSRSTIYGRARTFVNTGVAYSGSKAITLDADRNHAAGNISYLYATFNLGNYTTATNDLRLDFQYLNHGQVPSSFNRVWVRGSDTQPWVEAYKLDSTDHALGSYLKSGSIEISNILAANGQALTPGFGVRWGQWGQYQATDRQTAAGYTLDDIRLYEVFNDVQLVQIDEPKQNNCALTSATTVKITVRNASNSTLTNIPVHYRINSGALVTEMIPSLGPKASLQYSFTTAANFSQLGANNLQVYVDYSADSYRENDSAATVVYNMPLVNTYPYLQNFETDNGFFYTGGERSSWEYGTPASGKIRTAASGAKAWKTSLAGNYNDNELSYLYTPCFDLTGMTAPTLSFSIALDIEDCGGTLCDGAWVEYSTDGINWAKLGANGTGTNWYNKTGANLWSTQFYSYWHVATQALPTGVSRLRLRFVMDSDPAVGKEGIAIDDIHVYDNTQGIYDAVTMASPVTQTVSGSNWTHFTSGGKLIASVQPNHANLGTTDVQAYIHTGTVRVSSNQYYHNRNVTIKPANTTLPDSVLVRFYFLDSEMETLLSANSCAGCSKPGSAYELGVTKYTDSDKSKENGTIADNLQNGWKFIPSSEVVKVPFDKGYYAEFKIAGFSEFWLNNGGFNSVTPLPVKLSEFTVSRSGQDVDVRWNVASENAVIRYEIEVARGNTAISANRFEKIGEVVSAGTSTVQRQYNFSDHENDKAGARYYRLKIIHADGSFDYSEVKAVMFGDAVLWQVYPNPSSGKFNLVYQLNADELLVAGIYDAKGSLVKEYRSRANGFLQKLSIDIAANNYANGIYLLRVNAAGKQQSFKLYKQ
ncbi:MAG: T9SS type A sorting domain-containing protein [Chitinophagaceae bacterium]|nr:MAG: T9SS type A sorting domain-containing protein [Chitinophagaceae bacterium]